MMDETLQDSPLSEAYGHAFVNGIITTALVRHLVASGVIADRAEFIETVMQVAREALSKLPNATEGQRARADTLRDVMADISRQVYGPDRAS